MHDAASKPLIFRKIIWEFHIWDFEIKINFSHNTWKPEWNDLNWNNQSYQTFKVLHFYKKYSNLKFNTLSIRKGWTQIYFRANFWISFIFKTKNTYLGIRKWNVITFYEHICSPTSDTKNCSFWSILAHQWPPRFLPFIYYYYFPDNI